MGDGNSLEGLVLQRDFVLLRDFGYDYETLPLRRFGRRWLSRARVRWRCEQYAA